jgi:hypothetical protein
MIKTSVAAGSPEMQGVYPCSEFLVQKQEAFLPFGILFWRGGTAEALQ